VKIPENLPLLFSWDPKKWLPGWLWLFVPLSALAHAASFFLFRVVYPNHPSLPFTPPRVVLLNNSLPEHAPLLQWIDTHNPALLAPPVTDSAQLPLAEPTYRSSFQSIHTEPAPPPKESVSTEAPSVFSSLTLLRTRDSSPAPVVPPRPQTPTTVRISTELQARSPSAPILLVSLAPARPMPSPRFLLGVTDRGMVRFIFLQNGSGDDALDEAASQALAQIQFQPGSPPVTWGFATVEWGDPAAQGPKPERAPSIPTIPNAVDQP
jgi:hypothetical protein